MARSLRIAYPGAYYHVTSRGNEQKDVFKSRRDREKFLEYLASEGHRCQSYTFDKAVKLSEMTGVLNQ
jgi:REP element-mobilizing transposase RayT